MDRLVDIEGSSELLLLVLLLLYPRARRTSFLSVLLSHTYLIASTLNARAAFALLYY
ncbi:hypothetical protein OH77DRAFT_1420686 [Trametes cingulata]|nr:hypothetical protein OH77DRAFT_1420686 [Trametes cingulata]